MKLSAIAVNSAVGNDFVETEKLQFGLIKTELGFVKTIRWLREPRFSISTIVNGTLYSSTVQRSVNHQEIFGLVQTFVAEVLRAQG